MARSGSRRVRVLVVVVALLGGLLVATGIAGASNAVAGLQGDAGEVSVPTWLFLMTGGAVIAASGMLSMLVTDRAFLEAIHTWTWRPPAPATAARWAGYAGGAVGLVGLALVIYTGLTGPQLGSASFAVLVVFVGGRAGLTMMAYLVGNPWPALNPWRRIAAALPNGFFEYPEGLRKWPAVAALLALIWIEVIAPVTEDPTALTWVLLGYTAYTLAGAVAFSPGTWFREADPVALWFRFYGSVAPLQRGDDGWSLRAPGSRLRDSDLVTDASGVAFVVLLVWELTFSGFVVTPPGARTAEFVVGLGVPPLAAYLLLLLGGYALFLAGYRLAARLSRRQASTYLTARYLALRFAPPLLGIAAGYHLAHYFNFLLGLSPSLWIAVTNPLSPPAPAAFSQLVLPWWTEYLEIAFILLGHVLAIWVAHAASFELFPGRLQAIRSQFPFIAVMVLYTMLSLWLVSLPTASPPYVQV